MFAFEQMSAAAFTKGLLDLEGDSLVPILASLVNKDEQVLDAFGKGVSETMQSVKLRLHSVLAGGLGKVRRLSRISGESANNTANSDSDGVLSLVNSPTKNAGGLGGDGSTTSGSECSAQVIAGLPEKPSEVLQSIYLLTRSLCDDLLSRLDDPDADEEQEQHVFHTYERWRVLMQTFHKRGRFNISKIPDIYDSAKYDLLHNKKLHMANIEELFTVSQQMADIVVPNEYGITPEERLDIGKRICSELLGKLCRDFSYTRQASTEMDAQAVEQQGKGEDFDDEHEHSIKHRLAAEFADDIKTPERDIRTRIYFTSESHIHALINVLRYGCGPCTTAGEPKEKAIVSEAGLEVLKKAKEFDYLSQVVFRVFENLDEPPDSSSKFTVEVKFSPGTVGDPLSIANLDTDFMPATPLEPISGCSASSERNHNNEANHLVSLDDFEELIGPFATHKRKESIVPNLNLKLA